MVPLNPRRTRTYAAQGPLERMHRDDDVSGLTESLPVKLSPEDKAELSMLKHTMGRTEQDIAREFIKAGLRQKREEYRLALRFARSEEITGKSRGNHE